jgi:hypothetical protein
MICVVFRHCGFPIEAKHRCRHKACDQLKDKANGGHSRGKGKGMAKLMTHAKGFWGGSQDSDVSF